MGDKFDSTKWTGDVPKREPVVIDSAEGQKVVGGVVRNVLLLVVVLGAAGIIVGALF